MASLGEGWKDGKGLSNRRDGGRRDPGGTADLGVCAKLRTVTHYPKIKLKSGGAEGRDIPPPATNPLAEWKMLRPWMGVAF